jgi:hypothetical protein
MIIDSIRGEYRRYKALAEAAMAQLSDRQLVARDSASDNSIAIICWHVSGNLESRFSDFLTADGEKPWRDRDEEFAPRDVTREALLEKWDKGWAVLLSSLDALTDEQLFAPVTIRHHRFFVHDALHRSLAHTVYHVGQIVFLAKAMTGDAWRSLSIPPGQSAEFNATGGGSQSPEAHADMLRQRGLER